MPVTSLSGLNGNQMRAEEIYAQLTSSSDIHAQADPTVFSISTSDSQKIWELSQKIEHCMQSLDRRDGVVREPQESREFNLEQIRKSNKTFSLRMLDALEISQTLIEKSKVTTTNACKLQNESSTFLSIIFRPFIFIFSFIKSILNIN